MTAARERAAALSRKMNLLLAVLPKKNWKQLVTDVTDFATALPVNPDFSRLTDNKTVSSMHWGSITFLEMDRMESVSFIAGGDFAFPLVDDWDSFTKQASFNPPETALFNTYLKYTNLFTMILYINRIHD